VSKLEITLQLIKIVLGIYFVYISWMIYQTLSYEVVGIQLIEMAGSTTPLGL